MAEEAETIELNTLILDKLVKAFKGKIPEVRVGILGKSAQRKQGAVSNAEIGAKHEFGEDGMPVRSFLRMPITEHLEQFLQKAGAFNPETLKQVIKESSIRVWVKTMGAVAENVVAEGFASGGFGKWTPSNMAHKKVQLTLVETQQLRNSISSEVK